MLPELHSSMMVSGGASVAILVFAGSIWSTDINIRLSLAIVYAIIFFSSGLLRSATGVFLIHIGRDLYSTKIRILTMAGKAMHLCAHALFICSFVVFCMGVFKFSQALAVCRTWVQKLSLQTVISVFRLFEDVRAAAHHSRPVGCIVCLSGLPRQHGAPQQPAIPRP